MISYVAGTNAWRERPLCLFSTHEAFVTNDAAVETR